MWGLAVLAVLLAQLVEAPFRRRRARCCRRFLGAHHEAAQQVTIQLCLVLRSADAAFIVIGVGVHAALAIDADTFAVTAALIRGGHGLDRPGADGDGGPAVASWWDRFAAGAVLVAKERRLQTLVWLAWPALFTVVPEGLAVPVA